jgi:hypothetical protein
MAFTHKHSWTKLLPKKGLKFDKMVSQLRTNGMQQWIVKVGPLRHEVMTWFVEEIRSQA